MLSTGAMIRYLLSRDPNMYAEEEKTHRGVVI
jgi:hypothetical protein